jgi:predicted kinase
MKKELKELNEINNYLSKIKRVIEERLITEGVYDPGILKCVFMAGGPGSGKSYVASDLFGINKKVVSNLSSFGLKVVNSDSAFEKLLKDNGIDPKDLAKIEKENPELFDRITGDPEGIRGKAKALTKKQQDFYEQGRLGMIIDGTGDDYSKIAKKREHAMSLGYDCYMVFVNTSLEVALANNRKRDRTLPDNMVQQIWKDCQQNLGKFQSLFGAAKFRVVDNTLQTPVTTEMKKVVAHFINTPLQNPIGKQWVDTQKKLKAGGLI